MSRRWVLGLCRRVRGGFDIVLMRGCMYSRESIEVFIIIGRKLSIGANNKILLIIIEQQSISSIIVINIITVLIINIKLIYTIGSIFLDRFDKSVVTMCLTWLELYVAALD